MALQTWEVSGKGWLRERVLSIPVRLSSTARDAGNTGNTTLLRSGLTLGKITSGGEYAEYVDGHNDGTETATGILMHHVDLADDGTAADKFGDMLVIGTVYSTNLIGWDAAAAADLAGKIYALTA